MKDTLSPRALSITTWAEVMAYVSELESQRDELAAALRDLWELRSSILDEAGKEGFTTTQHRIEQALTNARAVLAKVTV